jgi:hypothetical protein
MEFCHHLVALCLRVEKAEEDTVGITTLKLAEVVITYRQTCHMLKDWPCGSSSACDQITVHSIPWHVLQARRNTTSFNP